MENQAASDKEAVLMLFVKRIMKGNDAKRHATGLPAALAPWIQSNKMQTGQSRIFWELSLQQQENIHISCISQEGARNKVLKSKLCKGL